MRLWEWGWIIIKIRLILIFLFMQSRYNFHLIITLFLIPEFYHIRIALSLLNIIQSPIIILINQIFISVSTHITLWVHLIFICTSAETTARVAALSLLLFFYQFTRRGDVDAVTALSALCSLVWMGCRCASVVPFIYWFCVFLVNFIVSRVHT